MNTLYDRQTNQQTDGHECQLECYTSVRVIILFTCHENDHGLILAQYIPVHRDT